MYGNRKSKQIERFCFVVDSIIDERKEKRIKNKKKIRMGVEPNIPGWLSVCSVAAFTDSGGSNHWAVRPDVQQEI